MNYKSVTQTTYITCAENWGVGNLSHYYIMKMVVVAAAAAAAAAVISYRTLFALQAASTYNAMYTQ